MHRRKSNELARGRFAILWKGTKMWLKYFRQEITGLQHLDSFRLFADKGEQKNAGK
jgi:hypothetical protein